MNKQDLDILNALFSAAYENQRLLAERVGYSLGAVNRSVRVLTEQGYLDKAGHPTEQAKELSLRNAPQRAIILAAGFAARMVPINLETPKALLEVNGEPLIERQIKQLHAVGITEIYVVVGYLKERFDYLIDEYGVQLVVSSSYATKNNLHSLCKVLKHLQNAYIIPCDLWCRENPFHSRELYSWYMVSEQQDADSAVRVNRKQELVLTEPGKPGNTMLGISYLTAEDAKAVRDKIEQLCADHRHDGDFWDFFAGKTPETALPVGVVLTIAASGSEGSPNAIITNEKTLEKTAAEADCIRPKFSIMDPVLTESLPPFQTACGITDIISHAFERYFTPTKDVETTHGHHLPCLRTLLHPVQGCRDHGPHAGGHRAGHDARGTPRDEGSPRL